MSRQPLKRGDSALNETDLVDRGGVVGVIGVSGSFSKRAVRLALLALLLLLGEVEDRGVLKAPSSVVLGVLNAASSVVRGVLNASASCVKETDIELGVNVLVESGELNSVCIGSTPDASVCAVPPPPSPSCVDGGLSSEGFILLRKRNSKTKGKG